MNQICKATTRRSRPSRAAALGMWMLAGLALTACGGGDKEKKPGQALVDVDGTEITVLQLNDELQRAAVPAAQQEAASKQLLDALVERQLLLAQAEKDKLDRDPKVLQAIERAKALILAQSYLQKRIGQVAKPTQEEVTTYFHDHPELFARRKQFELRQLVLDSAGLDPKLGQEISEAKSLETVATRLDEAKVAYVRKTESRSSMELPPPLVKRLQSMGKTDLLLVKEGPRSVLISVAEVRDQPISLAQASPQIEQFLFNKKNKDASTAELARLRASAKITYLNKALAPTPAGEAAPASASAAASAAAAPSASTPAAVPAPAEAGGDSTARGAAGLK